MLGAGGQLLDTHLDAALAGDAGDIRARKRHLHTHRRGQAVAHGAEPAGVEPLARPVEQVVLGRKHLMLSHVRGDERLAFRDPVQRLDHILGLDERTDAGFVARRRVQPVTAAPLVDLLPPFRKRFGVGPLTRRVDLVEHLLQHGVAGADDGNVGRHILRNRRGVDVDVNDLGTGAETVWRVGDAIVEAHPHGQDHVGVMHRGIGLEGAVHTQHPEKLPVAARIAAESHQRIGHRIIQPPCEPRELVGGVAENHPASRVDHRPMRRKQHLHGAADLSGMPLDRRLIGTDADPIRVQIRHLVIRVRNILGNVDHNRPRAAAAGDVERLGDGLGNVFRAPHHETVLHDGPRNTDHVGFLKSIAADFFLGHLAGNHHQGDRIHVGGRDAGDRIGGAGARGHEHRAHLPGRPGIAVCGVGGALFVAHQDVFYIVLPEQGIVDVQRRASGIAPEIADAGIAQCAYGGFATGEQFH
jgi:hypothetical protein